MLVIIAVMAKHVVEMDGKIRAQRALVLEQPLLARVDIVAHLKVSKISK